MIDWLTKIYDFFVALLTRGILPVNIPINNPTPPMIPGSFNIKVDYTRPEPESDVFLLLTANNTIATTIGLTQGVSISIADFRTATKAIGQEMVMTLTNTNSGRLYAGVLDFPAGTTTGLAPAPVPNGNQYYGWIEFSRMMTPQGTDTCIWSNLSNVDIIGMPITITGTDVNDNAFKLGYESPIGIIRKALIADLGPAGASAVIGCSGPTGYSYNKILSPNNIPSAYPSYSNYINSLAISGASLVIVSDTPGGTFSGPETFTGNFELNGPTGTFISLSGNYGSTWSITRDQFTTEIAYRCDGGVLWWNGNQHDQNRIPAPGASLSAGQIISNSVFREVCVGINEGYFLTTQTNYSTNFPYYFPFHNDPGNVYAKIIHDNSNSYGFPYSDSNLKVQAQAGLTSTISFNIIPDTIAQDYDANSAGGDNKPMTGMYQFGIGTGSGGFPTDLGEITIGNLRYLNESGYGGFLPNVDNWTQMYFGDPSLGQWIWFKTPAVGASFSIGNQFAQNDQPLTAGAWPQWKSSATGPCFQWPGSITWLAGATSSPTPPTSSKSKSKKK